MSLPRPPAPPKPPTPGIYTRLHVQTMFYGTFYSDWQKTDLADMNNLDVVAIATEFMHLALFQNAAPLESVEQEWVFLPPEVLKTALIRVQATRGRFPKSS